MVTLTEQPQEESSFSDLPQLFAPWTRAHGSWTRAHSCRVLPSKWHRSYVAAVVVTAALGPWPALSQRFHCRAHREDAQLFQLGFVNWQVQCCWVSPDVVLTESCAAAQHFPSVMLFM